MTETNPAAKDLLDRVRRLQEKSQKIDSPNGGTEHRFSSDPSSEPSAEKVSPNDFARDDSVVNPTSKALWELGEMRSYKAQVRHEILLESRSPQYQQPDQKPPAEIQRYLEGEPLVKLFQLVELVISQSLGGIEVDGRGIGIRD